MQEVLVEHSTVSVPSVYANDVSSLKASKYLSEAGSRSVVQSDIENGEEALQQHQLKADFAVTVPIFGVTVLTTADQMIY